MKKYLYTLLAFLTINTPIAHATPIDTQPDTPIAFGLKTDWLAIKSDSPEAVLAKLPLKNVQIANWESSFQIIGRIKDYHHTNLQPVFVSPSIRGWVFVMSYVSLPAPYKTQAFDSMMNPLLQTFQEVQYFGSYRVVDYVAWAKAENGKWQRQYATADNTILTAFGEQTKAEKSLGLLDIRSEQELEQEGIFDKWLETVDEETPAKLADLWSINPMELEEMDLPHSTGWLGYIEQTNP